MFRRFIPTIVLALPVLWLGGCSWAPGAALRPEIAHLLAAQNASESAEATGPSAARRALLYLPNRLLDITDMVSASVGVPLLPKLLVARPLHVNAHLTRAAQLGLGASDSIVNVGKGFRRRCLPWVNGVREVSAGPVAMCHYTMDVGGEDLDFRKAGILTPGDRPFAEGFMDYWAVGLEAAVLPVAAKVEIHPVEIADALLGFFLIDLSGDDL